ncbi:MAG: hypothetical protein KZQ72_02700, partial [Candidatus Thiodiazotropha sp. (ex Cardiolucina cf. quadrata)]|nr:hypothetical protein [Candidatus Thiodiazotropha sp. (ex Cardiolucina cf. quadrata)]
MRLFDSTCYRLSHGSAIGLLLTTFLLASPGLQAYTIYVSSEKDNTITLVDGETYKILQKVEVGERPRGIALSKDGKV